METGNEPLKRFNGPQATAVKEWGDRWLWPIQNPFVRGALHYFINLRANLHFAWNSRDLILESECLTWLYSWAADFPCRLKSGLKTIEGACNGWMFERRLASPTLSDPNPLFVVLCSHLSAHDGSSTTFCPRPRRLPWVSWTPTPAAPWTCSSRWLTRTGGGERSSRTVVFPCAPLTRGRALSWVKPSCASGNLSKVS